MQTDKIYPLPLVLFDTEFWSGLVDWMKTTLIKHELVDQDDFKLITVTDDIEEVVEVMKQHRDWKQKKIDEAK